MPSPVLLREVVAGDCDALVAANCANKPFHAPWATPFCDEAGFRQWFAVCSSDGAAGYVALERQTGQVIGVLTLSQIVYGNFCNAYLGYYGMKAACGRGLMTEAVRLVLVRAFGDLGLHRIEANVQPDNQRSIALLCRLGFQKEGFSPHYLRISGVWRDHERWAIRREMFSGS
nr:GNAT family protein [uncultured Neokomagataea sp.]